MNDKVRKKSPYQISFTNAALGWHLKTSPRTFTIVSCPENTQKTSIISYLNTSFNP